VPGMHCQLVGDNTGQVYVILSVDNQQGGEPRLVELKVAGSKSDEGREILKAYLELVKPVPVAVMNHEHFEEQTYEGDQNYVAYHGEAREGYGKIAPRTSNVLFTSPAWDGIPVPEPRVEELEEDIDLEWVEREPRQPKEKHSHRQSSGKKHKGYNRKG